VRRKWKDLTVVGWLLLGGIPATAHHSFSAEFDVNKPIKFRGTIAKVELINPHAWIHVDVAGENGQTTRWMIEAGSPNSLIRRGLSKATVPIGTEVIVEGYQSKDGANKANGSQITLPDGKRYFLGASAEEPTPTPGKDGQP
jgi:hypothetical protein